jgi:ABC-type multidrug transport system ATPase subunit
MKIENKEDKLKLNAYHSPSPMNELCDYICTWEKKNIMWDNNLKDLMDTRVLIVNNDLNLTDRKVIKIVRRYINNYADEIKKHLEMHNDNTSKTTNDYHTTYYFTMDLIVEQFKKNLSKELNLDEETIANYAIKVSYNNFSISKSFAWAAYADYIIKNLKNNSNPKRNISIVEVPYKTNDSYEYLGKYYEFKAVNEYR